MMSQALLFKSRFPSSSRKTQTFSRANNNNNNTRFINTTFTKFSQPRFFASHGTKETQTTTDSHHALKDSHHDSHAVHDAHDHHDHEHHDHHDEHHDEGPHGYFGSRKVSFFILIK